VLDPIELEESTRLVVKWRVGMLERQRRIADAGANAQPAQQGTVGEQALPAEGTLDEGSAVFAHERVTLKTVQPANGLFDHVIVDATKTRRPDRDVPPTAISFAKDIQRCPVQAVFERQIQAAH
jgi:hypothetical protein